MTGLANILVLAPLSNLWWTRLYMDRKGILKVDEVRTCGESWKIKLWRSSHSLSAA